MDSKVVTVVISEDQTIVRHGLRAILEKSGRYSVVGEAGDVDQTLKVVKDTKPQILVLDLGLPGKGGIEVIYDLAKSENSPKIAVLSVYTEKDKVLQAMNAGAAAYIFKTCTPDEFVSTLDQVVAGSRVAPKEFANLLEANTPLIKKSNSSDPLNRLSKREREVFFMLANGMPNRNIAKKLFISPRTVETHRARVIKKLEIVSTADLIRYAIKHNLMTL